MAEKEYPSFDDEHRNKVSEPAVAYNSAAYISLEEVNLSPETFTACIKRAEDDFANGRCYSSADLRRIIKEERGWK